jgi:flagellar secretion chaperone FliS
MLTAYATAQYQEMQVQTTPGRLVVMLYDGALRFLHLALDAQKREEYVAQGTHLGRAQDIIAHLNSTLDMSVGEPAPRLRSLYNYLLERLLVANAENRADYIEEAIRLLQPLRDAWEYAERSVQAEAAQELERRASGPALLAVAA